MCQDTGTAAVGEEHTVFVTNRSRLQMSGDTSPFLLHFLRLQRGHLGREKVFIITIFKKCGEGAKTLSDGFLKTVDR